MRLASVRTTRWRVGALALAGAALGGVILGAGPLHDASASKLSALPASVPQAVAAVPDVIVVGAPALSWSGIDDTRTPNLWGLASTSALGSLSVKAAAPVSCVADGWLTLGAGNRADASDRAGSRCGPSPLQVRADTSVSSTSATIAGFSAAYHHNAHSADDTRLGALADAVEAAGGCVSAAGEPAALGAADSRGYVSSYRADAAAAAGDPVFLRRCPVTLVAATLEAADQVSGLVSANAPAGAVVIVVGVSEADANAGVAHLHVALAHGPGFPAGRLFSASTRRVPFVQLADLAPTVLDLRGLSVPASMIGEPWQVSAGGSRSPAAGVRSLARLDLAARQQTGAVVPFWVTAVVVLLGVCAAAAVVARREWGQQMRGRRAAGETRTLGSSRTARVGAIACAWCALVPAASFLAGTVAWWASSRPLLALGAATVAFTTAATLVAVGLDIVVWRRRPFGLAAAAGTVTFAVIAIDLLTGARLQIFTMAGYSPLVAGRFAGIGNVGFGIFAAGALLAAAGWSRPGRGVSASMPKWLPAGTAVVGVGLVAVVVDGAPPWGSDVGGVLALVPAFAVLAWMLSGIRVSWRRLLGGCLLAGVVIVVFAALDYARPAEHQTHLGRFAGKVLHGGAWSIIRRKALADVHLLGYSVLTLLIPVLVLVAIWLVHSPPAVLRSAFAEVAALRPALVSLVVMAVVGAVVNDSGVVIPAMAVLVVLPAAMGAVVTAAHQSGARIVGEHTEGEPGLLP